LKELPQAGMEALNYPKASLVQTNPCGLLGDKPKHDLAKAVSLRFIADPEGLQPKRNAPTHGVVCKQSVAPAVFRYGCVHGEAARPCSEGRVVWIRQ
jgi:hypothetical protein